MIMQMQQAVMKQVFANRCNSFKQECKATTTFHAVKNAEDYSIPATSHTEKIRYLRDSSGHTSLNRTVHTISCLQKREIATSTIC